MHAKPTLISAVPSKVEILHEPSFVAGQLNSDELYALQYFVNDVMPIFLAARDREFWGGYLQLSTCEPMISYALIAVGCLFRQHHGSDAETIDSICNVSPRSLLALKLYSRSVSTLRERTQRGSCESKVAMLGLMLYICIEFLQNDTEQALALYGTAAKLFYSSLNMKRSITYRSSFELSVSPFITTVGILGIVSKRLGSFTSANNHSNDLFTSGTSASIGCTSGLHATLCEIQNLLFFMCEGVSDCQDGTKATNLFAKTQYELKKGFFEARREFEIGNRSTDFNSETDPFVLKVLFMYRSITQSWLNLCTQTGELVWDQQIRLFEDVVYYAKSGLNDCGGSERLSGISTFQIGMIPALYFTAVKCRSRNIRRLARDLLMQTLEKYHWLTDPITRIIDRLIELEEEGLPPYASSCREDALPMERNRLHCLGLMAQKQSHIWQIYIGWKRSGIYDQVVPKWELVVECNGP